MIEKADRTRRIIKRQYDDVYTRLRRIFKIPDDEMVLSFEWDRSSGELILTTLKN